MAIFRDFKLVSDRSYKDRFKHSRIVDEAIRENIQGIIAEEAIIARRGDEFIKIPIRQIKEYKFIYQEENPQVGQGGKDVKPGDVVGQGKEGKQGPKKGDKLGQKGGRPAPGGDEPGTEMYEKERTFSYNELLDIIFDDLELPDVERKKFRDVVSVMKKKIFGRRKKGIISRLDKKKTAIERIKRKKSAERGRERMRDKDFPFHQEDLRYKRMVEKEEKHANAVVCFIRDVSWSMEGLKRYLTQVFFFLIYLFIRSKYRNVVIVFIGHHTEAKEEKDERRFFNRVESGGTHISSGYEKALDIIKKRYNPEQWNIYVFHCSDGDNSEFDNPKALELAKKLCEVSNLFGYCEVKPDDWTEESPMIKIFNKGIKADNFAIVKIRNKKDVFPMFKNLLKKERMVV